jgi:regulatory protein
VPAVTALVPDPRQPGYQLVSVDRGRFASLPAEALEPLGLVVGAELAPETFERLRALADVEAATRAALRALARRAHARRDLARRLVQRQHPPAAVEAALGRLAAAGLVDDARFAEGFAASRARRGRGPQRILRDLWSQGVERKAAEAALARALADEAWDGERALREAAERRAVQLGPVPVRDRRRRLAAFLRRRGFDGADVRRVVDEVCAAPADRGPWAGTRRARTG